MDVNVNNTFIKTHEAIKYSILLHEKRLRDKTTMLIPWVVGGPGIGKTEMLTHFAGIRNHLVVAREPALERVEKFSGIPDLMEIQREGRTEIATRWTIPELVNELREKSTQGPVICFFDDWHLTDECVQAIGFELFTHHSLNGQKLPDNVSFVLAGNNSAQAGARMTLSAIRNRCVLMFTEPDVNYWMKNYAIPNRVHETVVGFFSDPGNHVYFCENESTTEQFATPRSWVQGVSNCIELFENSYGYEKILNDAMLQLHLRCLCEGSVGRVASEKFMVFYTIYRNINLKELYEDGKVNIPTNQINRFAYCIAISNELYSRLTKDANDERSARFFGKALNELTTNYPELAVNALYQITQKRENKKLNLPCGTKMIQHIFVKEWVSQQILDILPEFTNILGRK